MDSFEQSLEVVATWFSTVECDCEEGLPSNCVQCKIFNATNTGGLMSVSTACQFIYFAV